MSPTLKKYLHALEFAAAGAAIPVINDWLLSTHPMDARTVLKAAIGAALTGAYTYWRANPPSVDTDITPILPIKKP